MSDYNIQMHDYNGVRYDNLYPKTKSNMVLDGDTNLETKLKYYNNENLFDNWYFVGGQFPINQRGQTSYAGYGYAIDRWLLDIGSIELNTDSLRLVPTQDIAHGLTQYFESDILGGKTVTISALYKGTSGIEVWAYGSFLAIFPAKDEWTLHSVTVNIPNNLQSSSWFAGFACGGSTTYTDFKAVKLELGDTQTLAHQDTNGNWVLNDIPKYGDELRKCQRYYWKSQYQTSRTKGLYLGRAISSTHIVGNYRFPVPMASVPTVTIVDTFNNVLNGVWDWNTGAGFSGASALNNSLSNECFSSVIMSSAVLTVGNYYCFNVILDANL